MQKTVEIHLPHIKFFNRHYANECSFGPSLRHTLLHYAFPAQGAKMVLKKSLHYANDNLNLNKDHLVRLQNKYPTVKCYDDFFMYV